MTHVRSLLAVPLALLGAAACDCGEPSSGRFVPHSGTSVTALGLVPFDVDRQDLVGPSDHSAKYGKLPEIVVSTRASFT